jgi:hypothetical protein
VCIYGSIGTTETAVTVTFLDGSGPKPTRTEFGTRRRKGSIPVNLAPKAFFRSPRHGRIVSHFFKMWDRNVGQKLQKALWRGRKVADSGGLENR